MYDNCTAHSMCGGLHTHIDIYPTLKHLCKTMAVHGPY